MVFLGRVFVLAPCGQLEVCGGLCSRTLFDLLDFCSFLLDNVEIWE